MLKILARVAIVLMFILGAQSCSDSDRTDTGTPQGDVTPPVILNIEPGDDTDVGLDETVVIEFSEAMNQDTADGNVTVSPGIITQMSWLDATTLSISHTTWSEGVQVTVTIGTGLTDLAGNALPQAWITSFWTITDEVVLLYSDPADGSTDVSRSVMPTLRFSKSMNLSGLQDATTVSEPGKAVPTWEMEALGNNIYRIQFQDDLTAQTTYTIYVSTEAPSQSSGTLSQEVSISWTTGDDVDEIAPYMVSATPNGGTINPDLNTFVINFSEPIDEMSFQPSRIAGHFMYLSASEPQFNQAGDQMTVYLRTPLPAGVRLFSVLGPGTYRDLAGNYNTQTDSISVRVAGSPDYYPVQTGMHYYYQVTTIEQGGGGPGGPGPSEWINEIYGTFENIAGSTFDYAEYQWNEYESKYDLWEREYDRKTTSGLYLRGFEDGDSGLPIIFDSEVLYLKFPMQQQTWQGTTYLDFGEGTVTVNYDGHTYQKVNVATYNEYWGETAIIWEDCWLSVLNHTLLMGQETMEVGADTLATAPGLGVIESWSGTTEYGQQGTETRWNHKRLYELRYGEK